MPPVDYHIRLGGHVARRAGDGRVHRLVAMVRDRGVFVGRVTLQTGRIAGKAQLGAMRIVAIAAGDTGGEHLALLERAVIINLIQQLPIGVIEPAAQRRNHVRAGQGSSRDPSLGKLAASGVAQPARLDLGTQRPWRPAAHGIAGSRIRRPGCVAPLGKARQKSHGGSSVFPNGHQLCWSRAQATWREPCP